MGKLESLENHSKLCPKHMFNMCADRSKDNRNCVMPRCCGICNKVLECEGRCKYIKQYEETLG